MAISDANINWYLSGGAANSDPLASIGGDRSSVEVPTGLFDTVTGDENVAGDIEYRLVYVRNDDDDADGWISPKVWIKTAAAIAGYAIGLAAAGKSATETAVANENTAPAGVSFSAPTDKASGLSLPGTPYAQNAYMGIWIQRTITPSSPSAASDPVALRAEGDTI